MTIATIKQNEALGRITTFIELSDKLTKTDMKVLRLFILNLNHGLIENIRINQTDMSEYLNTNNSTINRSIKKLISINLIIKENEKYSLNCEAITNIKKRNV